MFHGFVVLSTQLNSSTKHGIHASPPGMTRPHLFHSILVAQCFWPRLALWPIHCSFWLWIVDLGWPWVPEAVAWVSWLAISSCGTVPRLGWGLLHGCNWDVPGLSTPQTCRAAMTATWLGASYCSHGRVHCHCSILIYTPENKHSAWK